jgi:hypothetical protein
MLHNSLIALALAFLDDPKFRDLKSRQYFAEKAKSFTEAECQKPNISVVQALSFLGSFHSSQGDQSLGYLYFGAHQYLEPSNHSQFNVIPLDVNRHECPCRSSLYVIYTPLLSLLMTIH